MKTLNLETAKELLHDKMENKNLRKHCYAVGKAMIGFYDYYKKEGREVGKLSKEQWETIGTLHDSDYEHTKDTPKRHGPTLVEWLKEYEIPEEMRDVFKSHNHKMAGLRTPETLVEWTLECVDELTGFIVACTLVLPSKKLGDLTVESITKKFPKKDFARAVDREQITQCEEKVEIPLEKFVKITLEAMQKNHELLGL